MHQSQASDFSKSDSLAVQVELEQTYPRLGTIYSPRMLPQHTVVLICASDFSKSEHRQIESLRSSGQPQL